MAIAAKAGITGSQACSSENQLVWPVFMLAGVLVLKKMLSKVFPSEKLSAPAALNTVHRQVSISDDSGDTTSNSLLPIKKAGKEIASKLFLAMSTEKGIHLESLLSALGALAGYACQISVREAYVVQLARPEKEVFIVVHSKQNGDTYYFGDLLNRPLAESRYSIWSLASGATQKLGLQQLIDLHEIFKHVTDTLGGADFGVPRIGSAHQAKETPLNYVIFLWPKLFPLAQSFCKNPADWPVAFGVAIQEILYASKDLIAPDLALKIVMESAVPMSKIYLPPQATSSSK
ncbi:hypothetical protein [Undibacterium sp. Ji22W]|uniref:hypothetical protein n=1 Tax=Undibacterium sp. Ji22W TaxID=3413038 RepID=UPI003BF2FF0E